MKMSTTARFDFRMWLAGLAALLFAMPGIATAEPVDLELVVATDASRSIDWTEARIQREGIASAFRSREIVQAIESGALGKIGVLYLDWSNEYDTAVVIPWTIIHNAATATAFADQLLDAPTNSARRTSISHAIIRSMVLLETNDLEGTRRTIDISGDGPNNDGYPLAPVREEALSRGITINGLPVIADALYSGPNRGVQIDAYYANCVIGGTGSFAIVARGFEDFAVAIRRKLILEISYLVPEQSPDRGLAIAPAAATMRLVQALPSLPRRGPDMLRPPATRSERCDDWGFGGYGGYGGFP